jgi:hypothetical protein
VERINNERLKVLKEKKRKEKKTEVRGHGIGGGNEWVR